MCEHTREAEAEAEAEAFPETFSCRGAATDFTDADADAHLGRPDTHALTWREHTREAETGFIAMESLQRERRHERNSNNPSERATTGREETVEIRPTSGVVPLVPSAPRQNSDTFLRKRKI